jgi:methylated-DNA-[protein]-cysteine S-methyltransferase
MELSVLDATLEIDEALVTEPPEEIHSQVRDYESGDRQEFDLEIHFPDSATGDAMAAMTAISFGQTRTYGELADTLDTSPIAVGQACARNPIPLVVPCHRVIAADGSLNGYSADGGIQTKRQLLDHERDSIQTELDSEY